MPIYHATVADQRYTFDSLKALLAKATPLRSGDVLAGVASRSAQERVAAQRALADLSLTVFLNESVIPYEADEVTRLIVDSHDADAFAPIRSLTVGGFRDWLLSDSTTTEVLSALAPGITPEMAAAVSKIMRAQDLISVAAKCRVVTRFRNTIGLEGRMSTRLQPNHPTDDPRGIAASIFDGLLLGSGDAVIGINPATDNPEICVGLLHLLNDLRQRLNAPIQSCILAHVTTALEAIHRGAPVDLVFQSIGGTEALNRSFGVSLALLAEAQAAALSLKRGTLGENVMYFETGQGSALSANAHHGVDQQTLEARAYAVARRFAPLLVNTVVGFIGPEYLFDGKQITRAGLEDHFCGKLLGLPMGCDICYTNHAEADQDDMDALLTLLGVAGCTYIMGVPGADDIMLGYQSTSFHDALYVRQILGKRPAPEFEEWRQKVGTTLPQIGNSLAQLTGPVNALSPVPFSDSLRRFTPARIFLGRSGSGLPTRAHLEFQQAHALARDAVHASLDTGALVEVLAQRGLSGLVVQSHAHDRREYLLRPDLGRRLSEASRADMEKHKGQYDVAFVLADGLSAKATAQHALPLLDALLPSLSAAGWKIGPFTVAKQSRVALGDDVAKALGARLVVILIGERPGLSAPDSLGAYLTWEPRPGITTDAERNCISNIRTAGLPYALAASRLLYLITEARRRGLSGVELKEGASERPTLP